MTITPLATKSIVSQHFCGKYKALRKIALKYLFHTLVAAFILMGAVPSFASDTFALAPGAHDTLVVFGPKGDRVAELSVPTISQVVTVGSTSFQISYGRDANNYITAIIAPSSSAPQDLHFTVLKKTVDADKQAVVTLTFQDDKHVIIDPGFIGTVTVDSHSLRHRNMADSEPAPAPAPTTVTTSTQTTVQVAPHPSATLEPQDTSTPVTHTSSAPVSAPVHHVAPAPMIVKQSVPASAPVAPAPPQPAGDSIVSSPHTSASLSNNAPLALGDDPTPIAPRPLIGSLMNQPPTPGPRGVIGGPQAPDKKLFWAEPITPPSGAPPSVGIDEMKLVAVHGTVTVKLPDGDTKPGANGMIVPSSSSIMTADNSSAAVFIGGVDSARILPNTDAKVTEKLAGSDRKTKIDLRTGTVFSRVGHRAGENQDFEVKTPEGVAAARGTSFAVCVTTTNGHEVTICATQDGVVTLTDSSDGHVITVTPQNSGQVSIGSIPNLPPGLLRTIFVAFLVELQQFNANMQAIANNPNPTPAELAYYNANQGFDFNTQFYDANAGNLDTLFLSAADALLLDNNNDINTVVPGARRAQNQILEPFGTVPLTPF
jgi:hypothetical protein